LKIAPGSGLVAFTLANHMKIIHVFIIFTLLTTISWAGEVPKFDTLEKFLSWADAKLASNDYEALSNAQIANKDAKDTRITYIKKLDDDFSDGSLSKIFRGRIFPADKHQMKLGGHNKELGHYHIDLVRVGSYWQLARIWQCR
jgi:hypothetical protein